MRRPRKPLPPNTVTRRSVMSGTHQSAVTHTVKPNTPCPRGHYAARSHARALPHWQTRVAWRRSLAWHPRAMPSRRWAARCVMLLTPRTCLSTHHGLEGFLAGDEPILIAGGGLGGLTAALALARHGRPSRVLEGAPEFGAIGYGIQFGPNVFHVFDRIGVTGEVMAKGDCPPAVLMRDAFTGDVLVTIPTGASFRARFKHPYIIIHRIDLHQALLEACKRMGEIELIPDAMVMGFEDLGDRVAVTTSDGRSFSGAALIGADGLRSFIRSQLVGDGEPRPIGYVAYRTIVPISDLTAAVHREEVVLWGGPGFHIVHYPLRHGTLFNIVAVFRTPTHAE